MQAMGKTWTAYVAATMALLIGLTQSSRAAALLGSEWTYQGKLNLGGSPVNDTADFEFTLWDEDVAGNMIGAVVAVSNVAVVDGLFTVQLDFGVLAFDGDARWLEIDVRSPHDPGDAEPFTTLGPRQPLTANPYSLQTRGLFVDDAGNVGIGTTGPQGMLHVAGEAAFGAAASNLRIREVSPSDPAGWSSLIDGPGIGIGTGDSGNRRQMTLFTDTTSNIGPLFTVASYDNLQEAVWTPRLIVTGAGNVGVGTATPVTNFHVQGQGTRLQSASAGGTGISLWNDFGGDYGWQLTAYGTDFGPGDLHIRARNNGPNPTQLVLNRDGKVGLGTTSPRSKLDLAADTSEGSIFGVDKIVGLDDLRFYADNAGTTQAMHISSTAQVGIGTAAPANTLTVDGDADFNGNVGIGTSTPSSTLDVRGVTQTQGMRLPSGFAADPVYVGTPGNFISFGHLGVSEDFIGYGNNTFYFMDSVGGADETGPAVIVGGQVGIGTVSPRGRLDLAANTSQGSIFGVDKIVGLDDLRFYADNAGTTEAMHIAANGNVGIGTIDPQQRLDVAGWVRAEVVEITGGSDIAEPYDVAAGDGPEAAPGMVVSINPERIGQMRVSSEAYDRTVAGIISGANGVSPGLTLTQEGTVADGALPVANVGRVWCWCDADTGGAVRPGDLLTTADTPGHAMRVTDHARSQGAIIGKAMSKLKGGRGLVLVLVSLQ